MDSPLPPPKRHHAVAESSDTDDALVPESKPSLFQPKIKTLLEQFIAYVWSELESCDSLPMSSPQLNKRVQNFLKVPKECEKFLWYGFLMCLDSFVYVFSILPIRCFIALIALVRKEELKPAQKCDLVKMTLFLITCLLISYIDPSRLYHSVRGQAVIKLYVIFNVLDVLNRLGSAFGHDILDSLYASLNFQSIQDLGIKMHFLVALITIFLHTVVIFYQMVSLNVAINSYSSALLPVMLSSNFIEIKSSVFKKCEERNLFSIVCAGTLKDALERFQLMTYLVLIIIRNFLEMTGGAGVDEILSYFHGISITIFTSSKPLNFQNISFISSYLGEMFSDIINVLKDVQDSTNYKLFITLLFPALYVFGVEIVVDNLKHAFITKFNDIPASIYTQFRKTLFRDVAGRTIILDSERPKWETKLLLHAGSEAISDYTIDITTMDKSSHVARRIGFVALPLACLTARIIVQTLGMMKFNYLNLWGIMMMIIAFIWITVFKLGLGFYLLWEANRQLKIE